MEAAGLEAQPFVVGVEEATKVAVQELVPRVAHIADHLHDGCREHADNVGVRARLACARVGGWAAPHLPDEAAAVRGSRAAGRALLRCRAQTRYLKVRFFSVVAWPSWWRRALRASMQTSHTATCL